MATKYWRKGPGKDSKSIEFYRRSDKYSFVRVWKPAFYLGWRMRGRVGRDKKEVYKSFKTKEQALKFAYNYMRKH